MRDAENRDAFLDRVKRETGFEVELLSGEEEARRTLLGIRSGLPVGVTDVLALDIGGGSTEFSLDRPGQNPVVHSIDVGVVRLCERLLHHDPPTDDEVRQAREWVARETKAAVADMDNYQTATFVGTAGTITSLAAMAQQLPAYEPARIHNYMLQLDTIRELEAQLLSRTKTNRVGLPGLEKGREEVIAAGAIIIRTIMETLGETECLVSDLGLREGVLIDLAMRTRSPEMISIIGGQLYQPIADLMSGLLKRSYQKPDRVSSNYYEGGYAAAIIVLLAAIVESFVQRDRYFYKPTTKTVKPSAKVSDYMKTVYGYRRCSYLQELFEVRNAIAHNHIWEIDFSIPRTGGRRHKGSSLVTGTHHLKEPPRANTRVPRTRRLRLNLQPQRLDRTDVVKVFSEVLHILRFLSKKGCKRLPLIESVVHMGGRRLSFADLLSELKKGFNPTPNVID